MILPDKHIGVERSLLGIGALIAQHLDRPRSVTSLWIAVRQQSNSLTFDQFSLALSVLYMIGLINDRDYLISKNAPGLDDDTPGLSQSKLIQDRRVSKRT